MKFLLTLEFQAHEWVEFYVIREKYIVNIESCSSSFKGDQRDYFIIKLLSTIGNDTPDFRIGQLLDTEIKISGLSILTPNKSGTCISTFNGYVRKDSIDESKHHKIMVYPLNDI